MILILMAIVAAVIFFLLFVGFIKNKLSLTHYVAIMILLIIFSPPISLPGLPAIRLDDLWLIFGAVIVLVNVTMINKNYDIPQKSIFFLFISFIVWVVITISISVYREPLFYTHSDWLEVVKNLKLLLIFIITANLDINKSQLNKITNIIILGLLISALFAIAQYFNLANINSWLTPLYIYDTQLYGLETQGRVVSFFGNPNVLAGFMFIGIGLSFSLLINKGSVIQIIPLITFVTVLFFTQSRTGLVSAIVLVAFIFLISFLRSNKKFKLLFMATIATIVPYIALKFAPESFFFRLGGLSNLDDDASFNARLYLWEQIYNERTSNNILTGTGPVGALQYHYDNEWLQLLTNYGLIGISIFLLIFLTIYMKIGKISKLDKDLFWVSAAWKGIIIAFSTYMITLAVFQQLQLMPLLMAGIGISISMLRGVNSSQLKTV